MKAIIIDIDGVCFDCTDRLNRCRKDGEIDWKQAFCNSEVIRDPVFPNAAAKVRLIAELFPDVRIVYMTGRSDVCRLATRAALKTHNFPEWSSLYMRSHIDYRPDTEVKAGLIDELRNGIAQLTFVAAIDDNYDGKLSIMYESMGIDWFISLDSYLVEVGLER